LTWGKIAQQWDNLFTQAFFDLEAERTNPEKMIEKWEHVTIPSRQHPSNSKH
jgi:hypothetical protein